MHIARPVDTVNSKSWLVSTYLRKIVGFVSDYLKRSTHQSLCLAA